MLVLHPAPTCADAGPDPCTLHPDLCTLCLRWLSPAATYGGGASPSAIGTKTHSPIALHQWGLSIHPLTQTPNLHSGNLHCVVVFFGGGGGGGGGGGVFWWWWW